MKKLLYSISTLLITLNCFSQDLIQTALQNKPVVILNNSFIIPNDKLFRIDVDELDFTIDKSLINDFQSQLKNQTASIWKETDFTNKIVVIENEKLDIKKVLALSVNLNEIQKERFRKAIEKYNSEDNDWRIFPIKVSRPLYSEQKDFAIIGIINGNNGGEISLYQLKINQWKFIGNLNRWAY